MCILYVMDYMLKVRQLNGAIFWIALTLRTFIYLIMGNIAIIDQQLYFVEYARALLIETSILTHQITN